MIVTLSRFIDHCFFGLKKINHQLFFLFFLSSKMNFINNHSITYKACWEWKQDTKESNKLANIKQNTRPRQENNKDQKQQRNNT
jgi:hypothetical protein